MLTIKIETGNSATNNPEDLAELLRKIARDIEDGYTEKSIMDYNGNKVGSFKVEF